MVYVVRSTESHRFRSRAICLNNVKKRVKAHSSVDRVENSGEGGTRGWWSALA
jgi:hypothetical protein